MVIKLYESGNEFKIITTDYYCHRKKDGRCHHEDNLNEDGQSLKWCDESICPIALSKER